MRVVGHLCLYHNEIEERPSRAVGGTCETPNLENVMLSSRSPTDSDPSIPSSIPSKSLSLPSHTCYLLRLATQVSQPSSQPNMCSCRYYACYKCKKITQRYVYFECSDKDKPGHVAICREPISPNDACDEHAEAKRKRDEQKKKDEEDKKRSDAEYLRRNMQPGGFWAGTKRAFRWS